MFQNISVKNALQLALEEKAVLLDLRSEEDYKKGHLPTAVLVPEERVREMFEKYAGREKILYCTYGNLSLRLARELSEEGYDAYSIVGGYQAYAGYVETKKNDIWTMEWKNS